MDGEIHRSDETRSREGPGPGQVGHPPADPNHGAMTVLGVGVDLVEVERIAALVRRHPRTLTRLFTRQEVADSGDGANRIQRLAARFALKEAVYKALGGTGTLPWREIQYVREPGAPAWVRLEGRAQEMALSLGVTRVVASISHVHPVAIASVTALGRCPSCGS